MPIGDDRDAIQLTRREWDCLNQTIEEINGKLDKVLLKLFGDPATGEDGMYEEHKLLWAERNESHFWRSKKMSILSTISGLVGLAGAIIALVLSSRQL